jgi:predicted TIM-barrel fold metal-dependent hydrolase
MRDGYRVLDADSHVMEPGGLFGGAVPAGRSVVDLPPTTPVLLRGRLDRAADQVQHGFDPPSYLRAMDAEGIDAAVLYPSLGLWVPFAPELDAAASARACDAYNEWVAQYCSHAPGRLAAAALVPTIDPQRAARTARRAAELGLVAVVMRPNFRYGRNPGDRAYDPLYEVCEETGLPLAVHEGLGLRGPTIGSDRFDGYALRHSCSHPMEQMCALGSLVFDGALERHPRLRVGFLESGTGWLPFWLARLADHQELLRDTECRHLSLTPAEYFARQCSICADPDDELVGVVAGRVGADHLMVATDFPHPEARYPEAVSTFLATAQAVGLPADAVATMLWDTPAGFYGLAERFGASRAGAGTAAASPAGQPTGGAGCGEQVPDALDGVAVNLTVTGGSDGDRTLSVAGEPGGLVVSGGRADPAAATLMFPADLARAILVDGDREAAMQGFAAGRIQVEGDMTCLLALQQVVAARGRVQAQLHEHFRALR